MAAVTAIMLAMHPIIALLLAGSAVSPPTISQATTVAIARARILGPAEVRRVGDRLEITTGERTAPTRSEEHTSELQSLMRISYAVFCLKKKKTTPQNIQ